MQQQRQMGGRKQRQWEINFISQEKELFPPIFAVVTANGSCAYKSVLVAKFAAVPHIEYMVCFAGSI